MRLTASLFLLCLAAALPRAQAAEPFELKIPLGLTPLKAHPENELTQQKIELGKQLYFDTRLSRDDTVSCASCHDPAKGWSNGEAVATGIGGQRGGRSAPSIINAAYQRFQFWDGRAEFVEGQALGQIQNPIEMNMSLDDLVKKLSGIEGYRKQFKQVFGTDDIKAEHVGYAIAAFERTILSGNSPYDRFKAGDKTALSESAQRGMKLFFGKANCSACHSGPNFSDGAFHNLGVSIQKENFDQGRHEHTKLLGDRGAFRTPTLRDVARTAPYMHDGSLATLEEVMEYYNKGGTPNPQLDEEIFELELTQEEIADIITFLKEGLASSEYPMVEPPELP
jgi:cytochrome c peroxidase